ncbi:MAG TPA: matrixin family metalloprotease [Candidatus Angelobacter sp.]|nr:matrixin family metalloprotease [Candidatus Angelobacter sp.]
MKIRRALPPLIFVSGFCARAFVVDLNSTGDPLRWHLDPLEPSDPPNAGGVHTNVVNPVTGAIRFFLASDGFSNTNTVAELNAVRASFAQWQSITGTVLKFEDAGVVAPGVDINTSDNQNVVFWAKNSTTVNGGMDNISGALGVTFNSWFPDNNAQAEADIVFNGVQYSWFTDFNNTNASGTQIFVESTALHEIGHFLGLKHSPVGGATMLFRGSGGVNAQAGLSSDEVAAVQWLYGTSGTITTLGHLQGQVTMNGSAVFGAVVLAEEASTGNLAAGTVTHTNGSYDLPAMPPGQYRVRVTPLDPVGAADFLIRGRDVSNEKDAAGNFIFDAVQTAFLPSNDADITLAAGTTLTQSFTVTSGSPAFRITQIRTPSNNSGSFNWSSLPTTIRPGQSNLIIGVASADLPTSGATLAITGDGLTLGAPAFSTLSGLNFVSIPISVAGNASPGLRSFVIQRGADLAYANGFLDIQSLVPDFNFDGLDDRFQRQYFALFTASEAGPGADPDGDTFNNQDEYIAGTNPTNALSLLKIDSIVMNAGGSTIAWQSGPGRNYRVWSRRDVANDPWQTVGSPVASGGASTQFTDASATNGFRFYRVQALP